MITVHRKNGSAEVSKNLTTRVIWKLRSLIAKIQ